jgi:hypothetical protein
VENLDNSELHSSLIALVIVRGSLIGGMGRRRASMSALSEADIAVAHLQQEASIFLWSHFRQLLGRAGS